MENQERKSKWDELALELGAQIAPEVLEREKVVATKNLSATPAVEKLAEFRPPLPKRPAAGWDSLASEFGLAPAEPIAPGVQEPMASLVRDETEETQRATHVRSDQRQRGRPERSASSVEHRDIHRKRHEPESKAKQSKRQSDQVVTERPQCTSSDGGADDSAKVAAEPETTPAPLKPREESVRGAAVSLWHKIFGSPAQQTAKLAEKSSTLAGEQPVERDVVEEGDSTRAEEVDVLAAPGERDLDVAEANDGEGASLVEPTATEDVRAERRRGRRRRRGGRGRKSIDRQVVAGQETTNFPGVVESAGDAYAISGEELEENLSTFGQTSHLEAAADGGEDVDDGSPHSGRSKAAQRAIPSWDEVIGFIVDSNLQNRAQRRPPSRSASRGKSSRG